MKQDFIEALDEIRDNKEAARELGSRNRELLKYLDDTYELETGTAKAWVDKKIKEEQDKDRTEDVHEVELLLQD